MEKVRRTPASLKKMVEIFGMEILHKGRDFDNTVVTISDVNRPALQLVGFYDYFDDKRLQILGRGEMRFLDRMTETERMRVFNIRSLPSSWRGKWTSRRSWCRWQRSMTARCCGPRSPPWT